ncbi:MAG: hypothetical protein V1773_05945 [bacterium]
MTINDVFDELDVHFKRVDKLIPEIKGIFPLSNKDFESIEVVKTIDSFIYRFIKIQDKMGEKLFPYYLRLIQEYKENLAFIDILNKLEKFGLIESFQEWIDFRKLRNTLTHEYPGNEEEIIESIKLAVEVYSRINEIYLSIKSDVLKRGLLGGIETSN